MCSSMHGVRITRIYIRSRRGATPFFPLLHSIVSCNLFRGQLGGGLQSSVGYCSGGFFNISQVLINQPRIHSCAHACMACLSQGSKSDLGGGGGATPFFPLLNSIVSCNLIQSSIGYYSGGSRGGYKHDKCDSQESRFFNLSQVLINQPRMTHKTCELTCK